MQEKAIFDKNAASFPFKLEADEKDAFKWTIAFTAPVSRDFPPALILAKM